MKRSRAVLEWIQKGEQIGIQKGEQIGIQKGERIGRLEFLEAAIASKFSELPPAVLERLRQLPDEQLKAMPKLLFTAATLADLGL